MVPLSHLTALQEALGDHAACAPAISRSHPRGRILLVDDDNVVRLLYSKVLVRSGYHVDTAEDGEAGWKLLHAARSAPDSYDLLITDLNMPKLTGFELIEKLRAAQMSLPVILVTSATPRHAERLQLAALLRKPFSPAQLLQNVTEALHPALPGGQ